MPMAHSEDNPVMYNHFAFFHSILHFYLSISAHGKRKAKILVIENVSYFAMEFNNSSVSLLAFPSQCPPTRTPKDYYYCKGGRGRKARAVERVTISEERLAQ